MYYCVAAAPVPRCNDPRLFLDCLWSGPSHMQHTTGPRQPDAHTDAHRADFRQTPEPAISAGSGQTFLTPAKTLVGSALPPHGNHHPLPSGTSGNGWRSHSQSALWQAACPSRAEVLPPGDTDSRPASSASGQILSDGSRESVARASRPPGCASGCPPGWGRPVPQRAVRPHRVAVFPPALALPRARQKQPRGAASSEL